MNRPGLSGRLFLLLLACLGGMAAPQAMEKLPESNAVVPIEVVYQFYDPILPWNKSAEQTVHGNALVVTGKRLLTTANLVKNANLIEVRVQGRYPDFQARVIKIDIELDLALLEVVDADFWKPLRVLPISREPVSNGNFTLSRWRRNRQFEQGRGEVVAYRVATSRFGTMEFPVLRARSNLSNLGRAEVLSLKGEIAGIVTGHANQEIQITGANILEAFLEESLTEGPGLFAHRGFSWQMLNHPDLRRAFGLGLSDQGVLITSLRAGGTGHRMLREGDILMNINGYDIDPEGLINHPQFGPMLFTGSLNSGGRGEIPVKVIRSGEVLQFGLQRARMNPQGFRVWPYIFNRQPDFEMFGGLVLLELSRSYLRAWGKEWAKKAPTRLVMESLLNGMAQPGSLGEKVVIISRVLPDHANLGYDDLANAIVLKANGSQVSSLEDFRKAVAANSGKYQTLELLPGHSRTRLIFSNDQIRKINARIRSRYAIPPRGGAAD